MTENEAIKILIEDSCYECTQGTDSPVNCQYEECRVAEGTRAAIEALKEVQEYRKICTLEELKKTFKYLRLAKKQGTVGKTIEECAEYEEIGTVEECLEAMERQKSRDIITRKLGDMTTGYICPTCHTQIMLTTGPFPKKYVRYCNFCGQKLEWEDA